MLRVEQMKKRLSSRMLKLKMVAKGSGVNYQKLLRFMRSSSTLRYIDAQKISDFLEEANDNAA